MTDTNRTKLDLLWKLAMTIMLALVTTMSGIALSALTAKVDQAVQEAVSKKLDEYLTLRIKTTLAADYIDQARYERDWALHLKANELDLSGVQKRLAAAEAFQMDLIKHLAEIDLKLGLLIEAHKLKP